MTPAFVNQRTLAIASEVQAVADEIGKSPVQVALAWLRQREGVVIPIIGARKLSQITDSLGCIEWGLLPPQLERLNDASRIELGFPHDFLASPFVREVVHAGMYDAVLNHRDHW
jgi:aryl-alcohol dehydrogenase-like predicted oxidoreductase